MLILSGLILYQLSLASGSLIQERTAPVPLNMLIEGSCGKDSISIKYGTKNRQNGFSIYEILVNKSKIDDALINKINVTIPIKYSDDLSITQCLKRDDGIIASVSVVFSESTAVRDKIKRVQFFFIGKNTIKFQ